MNAKIFPFTVRPLGLERYILPTFTPGSRKRSGTKLSKFCSGVLAYRSATYHRRRASPNESFPLCGLITTLDLPTYRAMGTDPSPRFAGTAWDRRVGQSQNLGRRRTDNVDQRRTAQAVARLGLAVKLGVTVALVAAAGATFIGWRVHLLSTPIAILVVVVVGGPWAVAHRLVSRSRSSDPFDHVDRKIWLP